MTQRDRGPDPLPEPAQLLRFWQPVENDRLAGRVYNRPGHPDGAMMKTSPVLEVRFLGEGRMPVAITRSGTQYCLGEPDEAFGQAKAEAFVIEKAPASPESPRHQGGDSLPTTVIRLR